MLISIPYGSIKSLIKQGSTVPWIQFQFLMVRLKAGTAGAVTAVTKISIPYGSIKREGEAYYYLTESNFNSLWFD